MTDVELVVYGEKLKTHVEKSINAAIEEALKIRHRDAGAYRSVMCQHADATNVGEDLRFLLLDFIDEVS